MFCHFLTLNNVTRYKLDKWIIFVSHHQKLITNAMLYAKFDDNLLTFKAIKKTFSLYFCGHGVDKQI